MSDAFPFHGQEAAKPSLHPALYGTEDLPGSVPTILVCPLPLPGFPHERLLPELSHELKTPLTGIMGLAQVLQRDRAPMADREYQYADLIYQRSQQLLVSINDLFDLAQLCTHQFVLQLRPIDLASVVKTALKVAQNTTPSPVPQIESPHSQPESTLWMMGDLRRVEQLLTHLIGYFAAQGLPEHRPIVTLRSHHSWLSITLLGKLELESALGQGHSETSSSWEACVSNMPGHSGTVLKFFLAKQLAQLHGGDVSWRIQASFNTAVTVLLPRDLTKATFFNRPTVVQPLFLIYAPQLPHEDDLAQALEDGDALAVVARSLHEVQEKTRILSPSVFVLESDCVQTPEWPAIEALLIESSAIHPIQVVWLKTGPISEKGDRINTLDVWSVPWVPDQIAQTLKQLRQNAQQFPAKPSETAVTVTSFPSPARPLIVLQIAQISLSPPESMFVALMTHLSRDFGCSVLVVDDLAQAELLASIWRPQVMVCSGNAPHWATHFSMASALAQLPLFLLDIEGCKTPQCHGSSHCKIYPIARDVLPQHAAQRLHETLTAAAQGNS